MKKSALSLLAAALLLPLIASPLGAEEGQAKTLTIKREGSGEEVRFSFPDRLTVHSAADEPMDWDYALVDEKADFDFGVRADVLQEGSDTAGKLAWDNIDAVEILQAAYLKDVHEMYDPKITSAPDLEFTRADGKTKVKGYLYQSEYWGHRIVVTFQLKAQIITVEFHAKTLETLRAQEATMKAVVASIEEVSKAK